MKAKKKQVVGLLINLLEWAIVSMVLSSLIILGDFNVPSSWVYLSSVVVSFLILYVFYWERGTYYFVSFVAGGVPGRVFLKFDERVSLDVIENTISGLYSGERVLVTGYKTVSRYEYELNIKS
ncbi:hypothetical protein [Phocaeicola plebeius]|jgi:hypothetical protein|uniref:Uncharacterized protein n=1 Tax=Phocaeicola plebeius TaxID=310297 RepID=A0A3E4WHD2_9BACT|nr:hypothetical protein [Phocaeicola plebeius]DAE78735.1 MAG TPA: hypothetical protein [Caudoviricetes sp.]MBM6842769.1 hypothetical protein [Phocaeicola plebeius]RGM41600.1 hypothetical protein DXC17_04625 [Phocaeicola plebeius]RGZ55096.1 hypothetical protein DW982_10260 [Phocaeicola plebeius]RHJ65441.1 hypothetical protein DW110_08375 [Phocaeicola plebeius]